MDSSLRSMSIHSIDSHIGSIYAVRASAATLLSRVAATTAITIDLALLALLANLAYNLYFHPLKDIPGPRLWAASRIPWCIANIRGQLPFKVIEFHEKYGPVFRVGPDELSYTTDTAWQTIYGQRAVEMTKAPGRGIPPPPNGAVGLLNAPRDHHKRLRHALAPAFSDRALREQEPYLQNAVSMLMNKLRTKSIDGAQDLNRFFNYTSFDLISELSFGDSFGCLGKADYHPFVKLFWGGVKVVPFLHAAYYYNLMPVMRFFTPKHLVKARKESAQYAYDKVNKRLAKKDSTRRDFWHYIAQGEQDTGVLAMEEKHNLGANLIFAGSETTATTLSGCAYLMLKNKRCYEAFVREVRSTFKDEKDITILSVAELKYLQAVINETLRVYNAVPGSFPRVVPTGGETIDGRVIPAGTVVGVHQFATNVSARNFVRPAEFLPERWLEAAQSPGSEFAADNRAAFQPFALGPRGCVGRSLALASLRVVLTRLVYNFNLELAPESAEWIARQKIFLNWEKPALMVRLSPRIDFALTEPGKACA